MPKKQDGIHNIHVKVTEENFRILQEYCYGGAQRLTASAIINLLMTTYIEDFVAPRMCRGESAAWDETTENIPKVAAKVAYQIEPTAFEESE